MENIDLTVKLSTLWIVVTLNMIFADIFSIMVELINKNTLEIPMEVQTAMAIAAVMTNIPILMMYFSRVLQPKINRWANMVAATFTIIFIIGGGSLTPHYLIIGSIEVVTLVIIWVNAWRWKVDTKSFK
jgi:hypothetical protein